jgi:hypothetical protein
VKCQRSERLRYKSGDLDAVITQLGLEQVLLVAHDASGPPAIDRALSQPERIWLFSTPVIRNIARPVSQMFGNWVFRRMYRWQVGRFFRDADIRREFVPLLYQQSDTTPSGLAVV